MSWPDALVENSERSRFLRRALAVGIYAVAMAYLEAAVVVYLQRALKIEPSTLFPLRDQATLGGLERIELGREMATLLMLAGVGALAGSNALERFAWTCVAFGIWDLGYYAWLWIFIGWPAGVRSYDLLFLLPVPWVAPVWAPMLVSIALLTFGLIVARRLKRGEMRRVGFRNFVALLGGGLVVIYSFTFDAGRILAGGMPTGFAWPIFVAGMVLAVAGIAPLCRSR